MNGIHKFDNYRLNIRKLIVILIALYPFYFSILIYKFNLKFVDRLDEILLLLLVFVHFVYKKGSFKFDKYLARISVLLLIFLIIGFLPLFTREVSFKILTNGAFLHVKNYMLFLFICNISWSEHDLLKLFTILKFVYLIVLIGAFVMYFIPQLRIFQNESMTSIFNHPGSFATLLVPVGIFALVEYIEKNNNIYMFLFAIVLVCLILAGTVKNLLSLACVSFAYVCITKKSKKYFMILIGAGLLLILLPYLVELFWEELYINFISSMASNRPRALLWSYSFEIACDFFPYGSGFGTYANSVSCSPQFYSDIYNTYGMSSRYGFERGNVKFLCDTYWPSVIGETGFLGVACIISIILIMCKISCVIYKASKNDVRRDMVFTIILMFFALVIESLITATFFGFRSYLGLILLGMLYSVKSCKK